jgi:hypothetical protein
MSLDAVRISRWALALVLAPLACTKTTNTNVHSADNSDNPRRTTAAPNSTPQVIETAQLSASVVGLDDMLTASDRLLAIWLPPEPGAPPINLMTLASIALTQEGFGPGLISALDLAGVHVLEFGFPSPDQEGSGPANYTLHASFSALDPTHVLQSLPAMIDPRALEPGVWEASDTDGSSLFFRAQPDALEVAMSRPDLEAASALRQRAQAGPATPRIHVRISGVNLSDLDASSWSGSSSQFAARWESIMADHEYMDTDIVFGTDLDLRASIGLAAPFDRLELDPRGPASTGPLAVSELLPAQPVFAMTQVWADLLWFRYFAREVRAKTTPQAQAEADTRLLNPATTLLTHVAHDTVIAGYVDTKGRPTIVFAASVDDPQAVQVGVEAVFRGLESMFGAAAITFTPAAVKAGKLKADLVAIELPGFGGKDYGLRDWFVGAAQAKLELSSLVVDGKLFIAAGAGHREFMAALAKRVSRPKRAQGLEAGGGLALARKLTGGCHLCMAVDPVALGEAVFAVIEHDTLLDAALRKRATQARAQLAKLALAGELSFAGHLAEDRWELAVGVPQSLLFGDAAGVKASIEQLESILESRTAVHK